MALPCKCDHFATEQRQEYERGQNVALRLDLQTLSVLKTPCFLEGKLKLYYDMLFW
jgi:hypothetical protein